jgi:uncharacterized DUF497 family protein
MKIEFDPNKDARNQKKHGISLGFATSFREDEAVIFADERKEYGETRYIAITPLPIRLHVMVYTKTADSIRIISLRKANKREEKIYAQETIDR